MYAWHKNLLVNLSVNLGRVVPINTTHGHAEKNKKANFAPNKSYAHIPFPEFYRILSRLQRHIPVY